MYASTASQWQHPQARHLAEKHSPLVAEHGVTGCRPLATTAKGSVVYVLDEQEYAVVAYDAADAMRRTGTLPLKNLLEPGIDGRVGIVRGGEHEGLIWVSMLGSGMVLFTPEMKVVATRKNAYFPLGRGDLTLEGHRHPFTFFNAGEPVDFDFPAPIVPGDWLARSEGDAWAYCNSKTIFVTDGGGRVVGRAFCSEATLCISCITAHRNHGYFAVIQNEDCSNRIIYYDREFRRKRYYFINDLKYITGLSCVSMEGHVKLVLSSYYNSSIRSYRLNDNILKWP